MNVKIEKVLKEEKDNFVRVSKTAQGIIVQPKPLPDVEKLLLHSKLTAAGAEYSNVTGTFIFPPEVVKQKTPETLANIPLQDLIPGPNPRLSMDKLTLQDLYNDIAENGMRQRIDVRPSPHVKGKYEIIDGNRRKKVVEMLGWGTAPCRIKEMTDQEAYETAFTVNNNRRSLSDDEKGRWFKIMLEKFPDVYPNQRELAKRVALDQSTISRLINDYEFREALKAKEKQHDAERHHGLSESSHEESAEPAEAISPSYTPPPYEPPEYVTRQIRAAPAEFHDQLFQEAQEKRLTAEEVKERALQLEIEQLISKAPEKAREDIRKVAEEHKRLNLDPKSVIKKIVAAINAKNNLTYEQKIKTLQEAAAKDYKKEKTRENHLIKVMSQGYPESERLLTIVVQHFGRDKPDVTARLVFRLGDLAVRALTEEQLNEVIETLRGQVVSIR
jgi:ParB/RepB/Spo0J family partition protein